jgi:hypothetical protein
MQRLFWVLVAAAAFGLVSAAAEKPPANYQQAMKDLGNFAGKIDAEVKAENYAEVAAWAGTARQAFTVTESYWRSRDPTAADLAQKGVSAAADLVVMAGIKNAEGIAFAVSEVRSTCMECHAAHRERLPDGTFEIK